VGIYRSTTRQWFLDINNDGVFNAGDVTYAFGVLAGDVAFVGDWTSLGKSCIGIYRPEGSVWLLDLNCNGVFDNTPTDAFFPFGGLPGDVPVVGNWFGTGTRAGVARKYAPGGVPQGDPFLWVPDGGGPTREICRRTIRRRRIRLHWRPAWGCVRDRGLVSYREVGGGRVPQWILGTGCGVARRRAAVPFCRG
jgi:hypothetical protein